MPCKTHTGPRGGKFHMERSHGGGTHKVYHGGKGGHGHSGGHK